MESTYKKIKLEPTPFLPPEIWHKICIELEDEDVLNLMMTCKGLISNLDRLLILAEHDRDRYRIRSQLIPVVSKKRLHSYLRLCGTTCDQFLDSILPRWLFDWAYQKIIDYYGIRNIKIEFRHISGRVYCIVKTSLVTKEMVFKHIGEGIIIMPHVARLIGRESISTDVIVVGIEKFQGFRKMIEIHSWVNNTASFDYIESGFDSFPMDAISFSSKAIRIDSYKYYSIEQQKVIRTQSDNHPIYIVNQLIRYNLYIKK